MKLEEFSYIIIFSLLSILFLYPINKSDLFLIITFLIIYHVYLFFIGSIITKILNTNLGLLNFFVGLSIIPFSGVLALLLFGCISPVNVIISILLIVLLVIVIKIILVGKTLRYNIKNILNNSYFDLFVLQILIISLLSGCLVRIYPHLKFSSLVGTWFAGNSFYPAYFTALTGKIFKYGVVHPKTSFSGTVYNYRGLYGYILTQAILFMFIKCKTLYNMLLVNKYFPLVGSLYFPIAVIGTYNYLNELNLNNSATSMLNLPNKKLLILLVGLYSSFYSTYTVFLSKYLCEPSIYGCLYLFLILSMLIATRLKDTTQNRIFLVLFTFSLVWNYFTASSVYLIMLITILLIQEVTKTRLISNKYIILYFIFYIYYITFYSESIYDTYIHILRNLFIHYNRKRINTYLVPLAKFSTWYILTYLNGLCILILCALLVSYFLKMNVHKKLKYTTILMLAGLITPTFIFFKWRGLRGVFGRMETYLSVYVLFLVVCYFSMMHNTKLDNTTKKRHILVCIVIVVIIITSILTNIYNPVMQTGYLTKFEERGILWDMKYCVGNTFTDFRIGTAPILFNYWNFTGIMTVPLSKSETIALSDFISVFYGRGNYTAYWVIKQHYHSKYFFISSLMMNHSIVTSSENFKPSKKLKYVYDNSDYFNKIYTNKKSIIYSIIS